MNVKTDGEVRFNPWSPAGTFVDQKVAITSPIPVFEGLKNEEGWVTGGISNPRVLVRMNS